jgi:hypothetical protein
MLCSMSIVEEVEDEADLSQTLDNIFSVIVNLYSNDDASMYSESYLKNLLVVTR